MMARSSPHCQPPRARQQQPIATRKQKKKGCHSTSHSCVCHRQRCTRMPRTAGRMHARRGDCASAPPCPTRKAHVFLACVTCSGNLVCSAGVCPSDSMRNERIADSTLARGQLPSPTFAADDSRAREHISWMWNIFIVATASPPPLLLSFLYHTLSDRCEIIVKLTDF